MTIKTENKTAAKAVTPRRKKTVARKAANPKITFELDDSPTAKALMKAYRMTHEQLWGAKSKRVKK